MISTSNVILCGQCNEIFDLLLSSALFSSTAFSAKQVYNQTFAWKRENKKAKIYIYIYTEKYDLKNECSLLVRVCFVFCISLSSILLWESFVISCEIEKLSQIFRGNGESDLSKSPWCTCINAWPLNFNTKMSSSDSDKGIIPWRFFEIVHFFRLLIFRFSELQYNWQFWICIFNCFGFN